MGPRKELLRQVDREFGAAFSNRPAYDARVMTPEQFDTFLRAITQPVDTDELAHDDEPEPIVSWACYQAQRDDWARAIDRRRAAEDELAVLRIAHAKLGADNMTAWAKCATLRNRLGWANALMVLAWIVAAIGWGMR